ncbi:MAG: hypothetical protein ACOY4P_00805, partial [Pseudomonadota bacterium]
LMVGLKGERFILPSGDTLERAGLAGRARARKAAAAAIVEGLSAISDRIDEGGQTLGQRYETNVIRSGQRRQDFQQDRKGEGGADDRFNERFYDRDQR